MAPIAAMAPVLWSAAGLGVGLLGSMLLAPKTPDYSSMMSQMNAQSQQNPIAGSMPEVPTNPAVNPEATNTESVDAERAIREQAALAEQEYNPTSGLGIQSAAPGKRKTLAGR